ncbi:MAG TPA: hypothetical protein DCY94_03970, partial [Firmicutes bacterium]|nr:hypothetical protein [Bacillota bacterium]
NKSVEREIKINGIDKFCINKKIIEENPFIFNVDLGDTNRYNQKNSLRCWAFSGINVIERNMAVNMDMDVDKFKLSDDYVSFFHRLEKANTVYEKIITSKTTDLNKIINKGILATPVEETGNWLNFIGIVRKYGLVPLEVMPTSFEGRNSNKVTGLFTEIVRNNCLSILGLKEQKVGLEKLRQKKVEFLEEHYAFLSKIYGEPVCNFDYEYLNRSGQNGF